MKLHRTSRVRFAATWLVLALLLCALALPAAAVSHEAPAAGESSPPRENQHVPFVTIRLGLQNEERGLRLISLAADGSTQPIDLQGAMARTTTGTRPGEWRFFYFAVDDTYIYNGKNDVSITIIYYDLGTQLMYIDYDSYNTDQPASRDPEVTHRRALVAHRTNTESWRTETVRLGDARFINTQGGADFRIGSRDALVLKNVSVKRWSTEFPPPPITVFLNGVEIAFDVRPVIESGRVLVPVRKVFEALGAQVDWIQELQMVRATRPGLNLELTIGDTTPLVNGVPVALDVPAEVRDGRTLVPLRFVGESFGGLLVEWDGETRTVYMVGSLEPAGASTPPGDSPPVPDDRDLF